MVEKIDDVDRSFIDAHWHAVVKTLIEVFGVQHDEAEYIVGEYRRLLTQEEHVYALHREPLDVGADLAQRDHVSDEEIETYRRIRISGGQLASP